MKGPNYFLLGPMCFVIAFLFYSSSSMLTRFEERLRGPDRSVDPSRERHFRILRSIFLGAAACFCLAGVVLLYLGVQQ